MSGKDFIKIMLCICGYDMNIKITTYRGENNAVGYRIYGDDKNGIVYSDENCEGLIYNIQCLVNDAKDRNISCFSESELLTRFCLSVSDILDDDKREKLIKELQ